MVLFASNFDKSKYLRAEDLKQDKKFRIKSVTVETLGQDDGKETKLVVWFTNDERGLVLNKTNNRTLRGAFDDDTAAWKDKVIIVFPTMTDFRGKLTPALRVRIPPPKQAVAGNGQAATKPTDDDPVDDLTKPKQPPAKPSLADELNDEIDF
jgi:hypothetical protein